MLKNYIHNTAADTESTLFTVGNNQEIAIVSVELYGGSTGGSITLTRNNGTSDVFSNCFTLESADTVILDHKQFLRRGNL